MNYTITRFDSHPTWHAAVMPDARTWLLYVDTAGRPYLYLRQEDVTNEDGDTRERYTLAAASHEPAMPEPHVDPSRRSIVVAHTTDPGCVHPFVAVCDSAAGMGETRREAVLDLLKMGALD